MIRIREEQPEDIAAIRDVNRQAFGQDDEGRLVEALRASGTALLSLVATVHDDVVGHILYTPVRVGDVTGAALGPMAMLPDHQGQGIGSQLVREGTRRLEEARCERGITCEWEVPAEAFMLLVLDHARMASVSGRAMYRPEFSLVT